MKHIITLSTVFLSALCAQAVDYNLVGSDDEANPLMFSSGAVRTTGGETATPTTSDRLLWHGTWSTSERNDAYLAVDADSSFSAERITVSGTGGQYSDLNLKFENNSQLSLYSSLDFNGTAYAIDMNFYTAAGATAKINFLTDFATTLATTNTVNRNVIFGSGLTVNVARNVGVTGAVGGGALTVNCDWTTTGTTRFTDGTVNINGKYSGIAAATLSNVALNVAGSFSSGAVTATDTTLALSEGATFSSTSSLTTAGASALTVAKGATLSSAGSMTIGSLSALNLNGTLNVGNNLLFEKDTTSTADVTIGSEAVITAKSFRTRQTKLILTSGSQMTLDNDTGTISFVNAGNGSVVESGSTLTINTSNSEIQSIANHANLIINGKLNVNGGKYIATANGGIIINSANNTVTGTHFALGNNSDLGNGKLTINADNDFSSSALLVSKNYSDTATANFIIGANANVKMAGLAFYVSTDLINLNITLGENSRLALVDFISGEAMSGYGAMEDGDLITITNFAEKTISIKNHTANDDALLSKVSVSGVAQLYWNFDGENNVYWLSAIAVPEPAEWAAVFGALALATAIYRRRK